MRTKAIKGTVTATADRAVALRRVARATDGRRYALQQLRDRLPDPDRPSASGWSATEILQAAVRKCEERAGLCGAALWLGEAWVDDPVGLGDAPTRSPRRVRPPVRSVLRTIQRRVSHVIDKVAATPRPGSGRAWLARVERELGGAEGFTDCLKELVRLAADQRPRVVVCGDYDTGKSSFIRRLLIEAGLPVPRTLVIRGDPATSTTAEYEWEGLVLVDTPGFQSGVPTHSGLASAAVADAAGVLYLFNGSLVTGDRQDLAAVLFGDPDRATPPKADRTLFVINRADELCPDPAEDVAGFHRLARRKRVELHAALTAQGGGARPTPKVTSHQIFCVASDPHQVAGPSLAVDVSVFDAERGWDGFDELRGALDDLRTTLSVNAVDVSVLCGGLARLAAWRRELRAEHDRIQWRVHQLDGLGTEIVRRAETGRAIAADRAELLSRLLSDFAVSLVVAAASEAEQSQQRPLAGRVTNLPTDDELTEIVAEWRRATSDEVQAWRSEALDGLSLRIQRRSFTAAFSDEFGAVDTGVFRRAGDRQNRAALAELANLMGKLASHIGTQQTAAATAAGAAARTSSLARLGVVIQGAAMVWDVYELVQGVRQERAREQDQAQLRRSVDEAARNLAAAYVSEDNALNELSELLDALATVHADVLRRAAQEREPITAVSDQISRCADLMADARRLLKTTEGEHDDPT